MARAFSGAGTPHVQCDPGAISVASGATLLAIYRTSSTIDRYPAGLRHSGGYICYLRTNSTSVGWVISSSPYTPAVPIPTPVNTWALLAATKPSGSSPSRIHLFDYSTGSWSRGDTSSGTLSGTPFKVYLGNRSDTSGAIVGGIAASAWFNRALSDAELDQMPYSLSAWLGLQPAAMWVLDQQSVSTPVLDWTGGGANQTSISGTTVSTDSVPILSYGHPILLSWSTADSGGGPAVEAQDGTTPAGACAYGTAAKVATVTANCAVGGASTSVAGKRAPAGTTTGTTGAVATGTATKKAPAATTNTLGAAATATAGKTTPATATATVGVASTHLSTPIRAVTARCYTGAAGTGAAAKATAATGQVAAGHTTSGAAAKLAAAASVATISGSPHATVTKHTNPTSLVAVGGWTSGTALKRATGTGTTTAAVTATGTSARTAPTEALCTVGVHAHGTGSSGFPPIPGRNRAGHRTARNRAGANQ